MRNLELTKEFIETVGLVLECFKGDVIKTRLWFVTPNNNFGGLSPLELKSRGQMKKVLEFARDAKASNPVPREWFAEFESGNEGKATLYSEKVDGLDAKAIRVREVLE